MTDPIELPFVRHLTARVLGQTAVPLQPPYLEMRFSEEPPQVNLMPDWCDFVCAITLGYRQSAPAEAADVVKRDTIRALTHELYGSIRDELIKAVLELRREGARPDSPAIERLERLIRAVSP